MLLGLQLGANPRNIDLRRPLDDGHPLGVLEQALQFRLDLASDRFARLCRQQIDERAGGAEQGLAGHPAQLPALLPNLALGIHFLIGNLMHVELAVDLHAREHCRRARVDERSVCVLDAPFVAIVRRARVDVRQPVRGDLLFGVSLSHLRPGQSHLRILLFRQPEDGVQSDWQRVRRCRRLIPPRRSRAWERVRALSPARPVVGNTQ